MTEFVSSVSHRLFRVKLILASTEGLEDQELLDRLPLVLGELDNLILELREAGSLVSDKRKPHSDFRPEED